MIVPILRLGPVLLTSIQNELTDQEVVAFQADVLEAVSHSKARGIVMDITGLEVVDSYMARVLNDTATMVGVLGTEAVITGMQPMVALTLVQMGRELIGVETALNLELGLRRVREMIEEADGP